MEGTVAVSVIIPVYNCEKYIGICIESVLKQTVSEFELILVDDGSPDGAPEICDEYARKDSRIQVIHKENGGVSSARNTGIAAATGEYITFIDSDDYVDAQYLQTLLKTEKETRADLVASGLKMENWNEQECISSEEYGFSDFQTYDVKTLLECWGSAFAPICMCGPCCKLYKREIIRKKQITFAEDLHCGEDTLFNLDYLEGCSSVSTVPVSHYHYRRESGESLFSRFHKDTYEIHRRVYSRQYDLMMAVGCSQQGFLRFRRQYYTMLLGGIHEYYRHYEKTTRGEKKLLVKKIAMDPYIAQIKLSQIRSKKDKVFLMLLKCKQYSTLLWLFDRHYKK